MLNQNESKKNLNFFSTWKKFLGNYIIEDHKADAFNPPLNEPNSPKGSSLIALLLNGYSNWDAKHFLYIAENGYQFENSVAFFPLYPFTIRSLVHFWSPSSSESADNFIVTKPDWTQYLLSGCLLNIVYFTLANVYLYKLTNVLFNDNKLISLFSCLFFCINPANVFFSAVYSESLFSLLTFSSLFYLYKYRNTHSKLSLLASLVLTYLSGLTRSNGLVNFGFVAYIFLKLYLAKAKLKNNRDFADNFSEFLKYVWAKSIDSWGLLNSVSF